MENLSGLTIVVDRNELQSDKPTEAIVSLGELEARFGAFGWHVATCDGHSFEELRGAFASFRDVVDRPQALVARTIKGRGVSFMEHPVALREGAAPTAGTRAHPTTRPSSERSRRSERESEERLIACGVDPLVLEPVGAGGDEKETLEGEPESGAGARRAKVTDEYVVDAYGEELVRLGAEHPELVVLDADLASDCRIRAFEVAYPDRFVECGIAEQDMVSTAGRPRSSRAAPRRQLVRIVPRIAGERADLQPGERALEGRVRAALRGARSGRARQVASVDPRHLAARLAPGMTVVQPGTSEETRSCCAGRSRKRTETSRYGSRSAFAEADRARGHARGRLRRAGTARRDAVLLAYGPVMVHEALTASEQRPASAGSRSRRTCPG